MEDEQLEKLRELQTEAKDLRERADSIDEAVAMQVGDVVFEWLDLGKKTEALKVIDAVFNDKNGKWYLHFKKVIYQYM